MANPQFIDDAAPTTKGTRTPQFIDDAPEMVPSHVPWGAQPQGAPAQVAPPQAVPESLHPVGQPTPPPTIDTIMQSNLGGAEGRTPPVAPTDQTAKNLEFGPEAFRRSTAAIVNTPVQGIGVVADLLGRMNAAAGPATNPVTKAVGGAFDKTYKAVKDWSEGWQDYQNRNDKLANTFLTERGAQPESTVGKVAGFAGSVLGAALKYGNPFGLALMMAENGIGKTHQALKEGSSATQAMAEGVLSADVAAAVMSMPGGPKAFKTLAGMIAARATKIPVMGAAWTTLDQLVDKLVMGKDMTWSQWQKDALEATKQIAGMELFGTAGAVNEGKMVVRSNQVSKKYVSPEQAKNDILGRVQEAHTRLEDPTLRPDLRAQAQKDVVEAWRDFGVLDYIERGKITYKGKGGADVDVQKEVQEALKEMPGTRSFRRSQIEKRPLAQPQQEPPTPAAPTPAQAVNAPVDQLRARLPQQLQERFDLDMKPLDDKATETQEALGDVLSRYDQVLHHAKGIAYAKKGKRVTDADVQEIMRNDPRILNEMKGVQARHEYVKVQADAIQQAREAVADKWRKVIPEPKPKEAPNAVQEQGAGGVLQRPPEGDGEAGGERGRVEQGVQGQETPGEGQAQAQEEKAPVTENRTGEDRRQTNVPVDVDRRGAERRAKIRAEAAAEKPPEDLTHEEAREEVVRLRRDRVMDQRIPDMDNELAFNRSYEEGKPVATLDVQGLKKANTHGQEVGTEFLVHIGQKLNDIAKRNGLKSAHISGDEFRLHGGTDEQIQKAIEQTNAELAKDPFTFMEGGKEVPLTGALHSGKGKTPEAADRAMAAAKVTRAAQAKKEQHQRIQAAYPGEGNKGVRHYLYRQEAGLDDAAVKALAEKYKASRKPKTDKELDQALQQQGAQTPESVAVEPGMRETESGGVATEILAPGIVVRAGQEGQHMLSRAAGRILQGVVHSVTELAEPLQHVGETPFQNLAQALEDNHQLQHLDSGRGGLADIADSMIDPTLPVPNGDLKSGAAAQFVRSPHQMEEQVLPQGKGPTNEKALADNHRMMIQASGTQWGFRTIRNIRDASKIVQRKMTPVAKDIFSTARQLKPLLDAREKMEADLRKAREKAAKKIADQRESKEISKALRSGGPGDRREGLERGTEAALLNAMDLAENDEGVIKARDARDEWEKKNGTKTAALRSQLRDHYAKARGLVEDLAKKHADVRVALLAEMEEGAETPDWVKKYATAEDHRVAGEVKEGMQKYRAALKKRGIPVLEDPYITHLLGPLDPDRFTTPEGRQQIREVLAFHHRQPGSMNLFPTVHGSLSVYIPTVARKLAYQPWLNKWVKNPYLQEGGEMHAPKFGAYLNNMIREMENPRTPPVYQPVVQAVKQFEILKTLAFSPRVAIKHAVKTANLLGFHHAWLLPAMKDLTKLYAERAENVPLIRTAVKALGGHPEDMSLTQTLAANLMATKQISRMLREDPMVAEFERGVLDRPITKAGSKIVTLAGYPVTAVEAFENGLNMMASIRRGAAKGMSPTEQIQATMLNILDYNYRSGADAAKYLKDPAANIGLMYTMTPTKGLEIQGKILSRGLKGEKDIFGSDETAHLIRHVVALGAIGLIGKKYQHNLFKMMFHPPVLNTDWAANMVKSAYYLSTGDRQKSIRALAAAAGDWRGALSLSPMGSLSLDLYALAASMMKGSVTPLTSKTSAINQAKVVFGGKPPAGYADRAHYLTDSPTKAEQDLREYLATKKGLPIVKKLLTK